MFEMNAKPQAGKLSLKMSEDEQMNPEENATASAKAAVTVTLEDDGYYSP